MGSTVESTTVARGPAVPIPLASTILAGRRARLIAGVAVVLVVSGAIVATRASTAPTAAPLRTANVARGTVTQVVQVSGSVNPATQTRLSFKSAGRLSEVLVSVGQTVAVSQPLARLDTTDLQVALAQAKASLASAQAKYDQTVAGSTPEDIAIAKNAVDAAQNNLTQAQQSTQTDLTSARQSQSKAQTSYSSAKDNLDLLTAKVIADSGTYSQAIPGLASQVLNVRGTLTDMLRPGDVTTARNALVSAEVALASAGALANGTLATSLAEYSNAADQLRASTNLFDRWLADGRDTTSAIAQFQIAQTSLQAAAAHLATALDAVSAQITSAQTSVTTAQTSLTTTTARADPNLDQPRLDVASALSALTNEQSLATSVKGRITQASATLSPLSDAVSGGLTSAQQAVQSATDKSNTSITSQDNSLRSAQLALSKSAASPKSYDIAQALANVSLAQAGVDKANNDLTNATLTAPSAGVIASISSVAGEFVSGGSSTNPFIVLSNTSSVALHGTVGEADVAKLKVGQVASVTVDALGAATRLTGRVTSLDPVATIQQGVPVYGVDITIDIVDAGVRPGMTGTANVIIASKQGVLTVPNLAIRNQNGRRFLQVMRNGQAEDTDVTFGIANDTVTEVTSGLQDGDQVVLPAPRAAASGQAAPGGAGFGGGPGGGIQIRR